MKLDKFGDSYDIVKQGLLRWLSPCGPWVAHPMFTDPVGTSAASAFSRFLGVPLLSTDVLDPGSDRDAYFSAAASCADNLFLDPDTGLKIPAANRSDAPAFVNGSELVTLARARPGKLTLVFDQSIDRKRPPREQIEEKLSWLAQRDVYGVTYESHACFVLVSATEAVLARALEALIAESGLPRARFVAIQGLPSFGNPPNDNRHRPEKRYPAAADKGRSMLEGYRALDDRSGGRYGEFLRRAARCTRCASDTKIPARKKPIPLMCGTAGLDGTGAGTFERGYGALDAYRREDGSLRFEPEDDGKAQLAAFLDKQKLKGSCRIKLDKSGRAG